jgi:hypothetical protein
MTCWVLKPCGPVVRMGWAGSKVRNCAVTAWSCESDPSSRRPQHTTPLSVYPGKLCQKSPRGDRRTAALPFPRTERGAAAGVLVTSPARLSQIRRIDSTSEPAPCQRVIQRVKQQAQASTVTVRFRGFGRFLLSTCRSPDGFYAEEAQPSHHPGRKSLTAWTREKGRDRLLCQMVFSFP